MGSRPALPERVCARGATGHRFRLPDAERQLQQQGLSPGLRYWLRCQAALPDDPFVHAAAFAYLCDWWLNYSCLGLHAGQVPAQSTLYISSLNHCIWFHRPFRADRWLFVDCHSPSAANGRGFVTARIHDEEGLLVASATQESLMVPSEVDQP